MLRMRAIITSLVLVLSACSGSDLPSGAGSSAATPDAAAPAQQSEAEVLEGMRSECAASDYMVCDVLYFAAPADSELEAFGDTCGERVSPSGGWCVDQFDVPLDLGQLQSACGDGDMVACDGVFIHTEADTTEEAFGQTCGGRIETNRPCVIELGRFAA